MDKKLEDTASEKGAEGVANLVDTEGESFSEANVGRAFRAFADTLASNGDAAKMSKHPGFQVLVDMVLSGMSRFPTSTLVQIIDYCGRLGFSEDMLLDEIARHLMDKIPDMPATDLVALTRGYAAVSHSPSILIFQAIGDRLREEGSDLDPKLKEEANAAFEKLGYEGLKPF